MSEHAAEDERVVVTIGEAGFSLHFDLDLVRGAAQRRTHTRSPTGASTWTSTTETFAVAPDLLTTLRESARRAHAGGDLQRRDQFANGSVEVSITRNGTTVVLGFHTDGALSSHERVQTLIDFANGR